MLDKKLFRFNNEGIVGACSGRKKAVMVAAIVFFAASLLTAYIVLALTTRRDYSIPSNKGKYNNSTRRGELFGGEIPNPVFVGPRPGATNISLDTVIYVDQMRPVAVDLQVNPTIFFYEIKEEDVGIASRISICYPAELLQPNTTYNVSGSIMGLSAWWIFITGSSIIPQLEREYILSPHTWWISIIATCVATSIFVIISRSKT